MPSSTCAPAAGRCLTRCSPTPPRSPGSAAIVYWTPSYVADAAQHLRARGGTVAAALLAHASPLTGEHIGISGDFLRDRAAATAAHRRPLNLGRNRAAA